MKKISVSKFHAQTLIIKLMACTTSPNFEKASWSPSEVECLLGLEKKRFFIWFAIGAWISDYQGSTDISRVFIWSRSILALKCGEEVRETEVEWGGSGGNQNLNVLRMPLISVFGFQFCSFSKLKKERRRKTIGKQIFLHRESKQTETKPNQQKKKSSSIKQTKIFGLVNSLGLNQIIYSPTYDRVSSETSYRSATIKRTSAWPCARTAHKSRNIPACNRKSKQHVPLGFW